MYVNICLTLMNVLRITVVILYKCSRSCWKHTGVVLVMIGWTWPYKMLNISTIFQMVLNHFDCPVWNCPVPETGHVTCLLFRAALMDLSHGLYLVSVWQGLFCPDLVINSSSYERNYHMLSKQIPPLYFVLNLPNTYIRIYSVSIIIYMFMSQHQS